MANKWDNFFMSIADANKGKTLTRSAIYALMTLAGLPTNSQGPTDYRGILDAQGNAVKAGSQGTQYRPILFVGTGDNYTVLPREKRVLKPSTGSRGVVNALASMSPADVRDALKKAGFVIPGDASAVTPTPAIDPAIASKANGAATQGKPATK